MASTDAEPQVTEQASQQPATEDPAAAEGLPVKLGYLVAAIAVVGLCLGAVVSVLGDESHVTTGGTIAAISAGLLAATTIVGMLVVFHHKRTTPDEAVEPKRGSAAPRAEKSRTSRPASAKRPVARTAAH